MNSIKIIEENGAGDFEEKLNAFCFGKDIFDIKFNTSSGCNGQTKYIALIIYEVKE